MKAWQWWECPDDRLRPLCAADLFSVVLNGPHMAFYDPPNPGVDILIADIRAEKEWLLSVDLNWRPPRPGKPHKSALPELIATSKRRLIYLHLELKRFSIGIRLRLNGPVVPWPTP